MAEARSDTGYPAYAHQTGYRETPQPPLPPQSSSRRVAAGVLAIPLMIVNGLGAATMFTSDRALSPALGVLAVLWLALTCAVLAAGIGLLLRRSGVDKKAPMLLLGSTAALIAVGALTAFLREAAGPILFSAFFGLPIIILLLTRMRREKAERAVLNKRA